MLRSIVFLTPLVLSMSACPLTAATIAVERSDNGATVKIDGRLFTEYMVRSGTKPILWPILGPTDRPMTRAYPMDKTGDETKDHPHQRSFWFTHGSVNGVDFWSEAAGKCGTTQHREFVKLQSGPQAVIVARNDWIGPDGKKVCEDERTLTFGTDGDARWIDFDICLKATAGPVNFADTKEGSFGVRVAETLNVGVKAKPGAKKNANPGGRIVNSEGQVDEHAWGKPAQWVDYHGPVDGQTVGIAILNHPSSFRYPTGWHVRTYGLFAANPFAVQGFSGKGDGSYTLPAGETLKLRYRVVLHRGDEKEGKIAEAFAAYAKE